MICAPPPQPAIQTIWPDCNISVVFPPRKCSSRGWPLRGFYDVTVIT